MTEQTYLKCDRICNQQMKLLLLYDLVWSRISADIGLIMNAGGEVFDDELQAFKETTKNAEDKIEEVSCFITTDSWSK